MATYPIDEGYVPEYHTGRRFSTQDQVKIVKLCLMIVCLNNYVKTNTTYLSCNNLENVPPF